MESCFAKRASTAAPLREAGARQAVPTIALGDTAASVETRTNGTIAEIGEPHPGPSLSATPQKV